MWPRSARFDKTVISSHQIAVLGEVLYGGQVIATALPLSTGSVTADRSQFARRTCTVNVDTTGSIHSSTYPSGALPPSTTLFPGDTFTATWVPQSPTDVLTPYGHELRLWRGVQYPDGGTELMPIGVFGIRSVELDEPAAILAITGTDRCLAVSEARFLAPRTILAGVSAVGTLTMLLQEAVPWAPVSVDPAVVDIAMQQVTYSTDRDQACTDIAAALGCEVFADPLGSFVVQPVPSPYGPAQFTVAAGANGALVTAKRTLTRDQVYNAVVATGTAADGTAVGATAVDNTPLSPTYFYGPYGQVPAFYTSSLLTTIVQCEIAANGILVNFQGTAKAADFTAVPNPALTEGTILQTVDTDGSTEQHLLESLTIGLTASDPFTGSTRSTTLETGLS